MKNEKITHKGNETRETRVERVIRLLETVAVDPLQAKLQEFEVFYPAVLAARHKGMKTKQILKILADGGMKLYPGLFEKLMKALEKSGAHPCCKLCGQSLSNMDSGQPSGSDESNDTGCNSEQAQDAPSTAITNA